VRTKKTSTYVANPKDIKDTWRVVDAEGQSLGRLAVGIARLLQGKNRPEYTPNVITGSGVIVLNAGKLKITGKKLQQKMYYKHSGYVGGLKTTSLETQLANKPELVIKSAVKGMLPKNTLGRAMLKRLRVYVDLDHPHQGQLDRETSDESSDTKLTRLSNGAKKKLNRLQKYLNSKETRVVDHPSFAELMPAEAEGTDQAEAEGTDQNEDSGSSNKDEE
jgi:large subunit ribosomal protein L13